MYDHEDLDIAPEPAALALAAAGYTEGCPPWITSATERADLRAYARCDCGSRRKVSAWHRAGEYRLLLSCSCGLTEEA